MTATIDRKFILGKAILDKGKLDEISFNGISIKELKAVEKVFNPEEYLLGQTQEGIYYQGKKPFARYNVTIRKFRGEENA